MSKLSFIYFDVGGVAIQDFSASDKWDKMMDAMGVKSGDRAKFDQIYDQYQDEVCLGKRHIDTLIPIYEQQLGLVLPNDFSLQAYFLSHFGPNLLLWPIIQKLKDSVKIGLLTDQYPGLLDGIFANNLLPPVTWDVIVDSSIEGVKKPHPEIYALAMQKAGVSANEILFIDNNPKNLVQPKLLGWQTHYYDSKDYALANQYLATFLSGIL